MKKTKKKVEIVIWIVHNVGSYIVIVFTKYMRPNKKYNVQLELFIN